MSQKNTHNWMIGTIVGALFWFVVLSILDWLMNKSLASVFSLWVALTLGLIIVLALENKYPSLRSGAKGFALVMVVFALVGVANGLFIYPQINRQFNPDFRIQDINDALDYPRGYTFYARIRNEGIDGSGIVSCVVTKGDLNTVSKSQTVYLRHNEEKSISFYFSVAEAGTDVKEYLIKIGT